MVPINIRFIVCICIAGIYSSANAQFGDKYWVKYSPEIRVSYTKSKMELRLRPIDYVSPFPRARIDFMIGRLFYEGRFKVFSYTKVDTDNRAWSGVRVEANNKLFDKKMLVHLQYRYFLGLNDNSLDHQYFIQVLNYQVAKKLKPGILGFYKKNKDSNTPFWFMGPSIDYKFTDHISTLTAFCKDILGNYEYFLFLRLNLKFNVPKK